MKRVVFFIVASIVATLVALSANPPKTDSIGARNEGIINEELIKKQNDSIMYSKLNSEQIMELKRQENITERERIESANRNEMPFDNAGLVIISIVPFVFVILLLWIIGREKSKESIRKHDLYMKSLELGQTLPENFFEKPVQKKVTSNLKSGILWLAVGLAILIYFVIIHKNNALVLGIIPTFVGIGYLLVHFLDKTRNTNE